MGMGVWDTKYDKVEDEFAPLPGARTFAVNGPSQTKPFFKETTPAQGPPPAPAPLRAPGGPLPRELAVSHGAPVDLAAPRVARTGEGGGYLPVGEVPAGLRGSVPPIPRGGPLLTNIGDGGPRIVGGYTKGDPNLASIVARVPTREQFVGQNLPAAGPLPVSGYDRNNPRQLQLRTGLATEVDPAAHREMLRGILTSEGPANQSMVGRILSRVGGRMQTSDGGFRTGGQGDPEREARVLASSANIIGRNGRVSKSLVNLQERSMQEAGADRRQESSNAADLERTLISKALDLEHAGRTDEAAALRALALEDRRQAGEDARQDKSLTAQKEIAGLKIGQQEDAGEQRERMAEDRDARRAKREAQQRIAKEYEEVAAKAQEYGDPVPSREEFSRTHLLADEAGYAQAPQAGGATTGPNGEPIKMYRNRRTGGTMRGYLGADGVPVEVK